MVFVLASGAVLIANVLSSRTPSMIYLLAFGIMVIVSALGHMFHHGLHGLGFLFTPMLLLLAILIVRVAIGKETPLSGFYIDNLIYLVPTIIVMDFIKTFAS